MKKGRTREKGRKKGRGMMMEGMKEIERDKKE